MRHPGLAGGALMDVLISRCKELGAEIRTSTRNQASRRVGRMAFLDDFKVHCEPL